MRCLIGTAAKGKYVYNFSTSFIWSGISYLTLVHLRGILTAFSLSAATVSLKRLVEFVFEMFLLLLIQLIL
jgi:hypothetical protein